MATYAITRPNGTIENIEAAGVAFETHHVMFMDSYDRPIVAFHADEVRVLEFE
ncbi:hypothetical protein SEA_ATUIN_55 [Arthrobacter phage Atuin]|nr:hypothetical protein SEA_ATUIN_154 [Arthrobacter phage Atuin]